MREWFALAMGVLSAIVNLGAILLRQRLYATGSVVPDPASGRIRLLDEYKGHVFVTESDLTLMMALFAIGVVLAFLAAVLYFSGSHRGPNA
jgi:hypothetical protein